MLNSRSKYEQIGVSNTFLRHTQKKLFTFKNSPVFFGPPCTAGGSSWGKQIQGTCPSICPVNLS